MAQPFYDMTGLPMAAGALERQAPHNYHLQIDTSPSGSNPVIEHLLPKHLRLCCGVPICHPYLEGVT